MEAKIRITVTTIIISRSEKLSGRLAPFGMGRCVRRAMGAISIATHRQRKLNPGAATAELTLCASPRFLCPPPTDCGPSKFPDPEESSAARVRRFL